MTAYYTHTHFFASLSETAFHKITCVPTTMRIETDTLTRCGYRLTRSLDAAGTLGDSSSASHPRPFEGKDVFKVKFASQASESREVRMHTYIHIRTYVRKYICTYLTYTHYILLCMYAYMQAYVHTKLCSKYKHGFCQQRLEIACVDVCVTCPCFCDTCA